MSAYKFKKVFGFVWGRMPSGEVHKFNSEEEYTKAYRNEENEIVDEMARLEYERCVEFPEDYPWLVA